MNKEEIKTKAKKAIDEAYSKISELESKRDQNPSYVGAWKANDEWMDYVRKNPVTFNFTSKSKSNILAEI